MTTKRIRLEAAGSFGTLTDGGKDRDAMLVYEGEFESMDGPVNVTKDHIELLVKNHNEKLAKLGNKAKMRDYPPIMLDHSTSARDVVGRLVGPIALGWHEDKPAIYGKVRILGKENIERVEDGRWTHLSIGADLETGTMHELTITPFPAAANAALLSQEAAMAKKKLGSTDAPKGVTSGEPTDEKKLSTDKDEDDKTKLSEDEPKLEGDTDPKPAHPTEGIPGGVRGSDEPKDGEKLEGDCPKGKKLSEDEDEDDKEEMSKLSSGFRSKASTLRLALRKSSIHARLSALKAEAKVTPAEMKKIDLARLASATDATVEAVLDSYKARQPVIHTGIFGSIKAESAAQLAARVKGKEIAKLEAESRARFSSLKNNKTKLSGVPMDESTSSMGNMPVEQNVEMTDDESAFDAFAKMIREGKDEDARQMFKQFAQKMTEPHPGSGSIVSMEEVQKSFDELCGDFDSMVRLAGKRSGVKL